MKKRIFAAVLAVLLLVPMLAVTVRADSGPKPSVTIRLRGVEEPVVMTLLSDRESYGPCQAIGPEETPQDWHTDSELQEEGWYAFRDYRDPGGFYFLGRVWENGVDWTYYPPDVFKVAVYYPERDLLWVSEAIYEKYAFRSDFTLVLPAPGPEARSGEVEMVLKKDASVPGELAGLLLRMALTIAVELAMAALFGFFSRSQRLLILKTNLWTQVGLNVLLWGCNFYSGALSAMLLLLVLELVVLIVESVVYLRRLRAGKGVLRTLAYTLFANLWSAVLGFLLLA